MHTARLNERTPFQGQVDVLPPTGAPRLSAWGQDVSETGMFLQTTQPFSVGDLVSLRFALDGEEVYVAAAEVMWVRKFEPVSVDGSVPGIGLRFVAIDSFTRGVVRRAVNAGRSDVVRADVHAAPRGVASKAPKPATATTTAATTATTASSGLPEPAMTLPPLSKSIIEAAGGRDLEDTQDLLPPPSVRRAAEAHAEPKATSALPAPSAEQNFSMLPFRALDDVSVPPDEPNLSSEARVFGGVPQTPRPITMAPRRVSAPPRATTALPTTALPHPSTSQSASFADSPTPAVTQKLFTLPPISVIEPAPSLSPKPALAASDDNSDDNSDDADSDGGLWAGWTFCHAGAPVAARDTIVAEAVDNDADEGADGADNDAGLDVDAIAIAALSELPRIHNPSILEAQTLPPLVSMTPVSTMPTSLPPTAAPTTASMIVSSDLYDADNATVVAEHDDVDGRDDDDGADDDCAALPHVGAFAAQGHGGDDGDGFTMAPVSATPTTPPRSFSVGDDGPLQVRQLSMAQDEAPQSSVTRRRQQRERAPRRRGPLVAAGILAMGCAAGAAAVMLPTWSSPRPALGATTTAMAPTATTPAPTAAPMPETPTPVMPSGPESVAVAEAELRYTPPSPQAVAAAEALAKNQPPRTPVVEVTTTTKAAPERTAKAEVAKAKPKADVAPQVPQAAAANAHVVEADVATVATVATDTASASHKAIALPGRFSVDLPSAGRIARVFALAGPARVVIDLEEASLPSAPRSVDEGGVLQVRFGAPSPDRQRVVVVLAGDDRPDAVDAHISGETLVATWQF